VGIDWSVVATIASPVVTLFVGFFLNHIFEKKPKLVGFLGHVSGIRLNNENQPIFVNTHSVILRNTGRRVAKNVRVGHNVLPAFQVYPDINYTVIDLPSGGKEIIFPALIPKKQITISYLYFQPLTWDNINTHLEYDEGLVRVVKVLPTVQLPKWLNVLLFMVLCYGVIGIFYTLYEVMKAVII